MKIFDQENLRLKSLKSYNILDSEAEKSFDSLTQMASYICECKIAVISLVDTERQWFKSKVGLDACETPRNVAFCDYAIRQDGLFIIENALEDDRFENNPLVTGAPFIRFYAGAVLKTPEGMNLGTLCVIDDKPKVLSTSQKEALRLLADQVMTNFELRLKTKQLEEEKFKSRQIIETINASPDFIGTCDLKGNITFHNESFDQVSKRDSVENIFSYYPEWVNEKMQHEIIPHARHQGIWSGESAILTKTGDELPVWQTVICHRDQNKEVQFYSTHMQDLSERKKLEDKLMKSFLQLGNLVENIPAAIAMFDRDLKYISASKGWIADYGLDIRGYSRSSIIGKSHYEVFPNMKKEWKDHHQDALRGKIIKRNEDSFIRDDGQVEWLNYDVRPWYDENGAVGGIMMLTEVITDKKNAEIEILKAKSDAVKASMAKSIFLANMSHEIRTPLNSIIGLADLLTQSDLNAENSRHVQVIQRSSEVLLSLINNILDLSKIESGEFTLEVNEFNFPKVAADVLDVFSVKAKEKDISLSFKVEDSIELVRGDSTRIHQILINLIGNALKFTPSGEINLTIGKNPYQHRSGSLLISVQDTGVGIERSKHELIFENFGQAETSTTRKYGGTGLGLAITKNLVQKMNGEIWVKSEPGVGSTFYLTIDLPEVKAPAPLPNVISLQVATDYSFLESHKVKLLLVDDSVENRSLILAYLKKYAFDIVTAENGQEALDHMKAQNFDLVFMDVQMPVMDGLTATSLYRTFELQAKRKRLPIVALTAYALQEEKIKCLNAGCDLHLTKPIKKATVLETIAQITRQKQSEKAL